MGFGTGFGKFARSVGSKWSEDEEGHLGAHVYDSFKGTFFGEGATTANKVIGGVTLGAGALGLGAAGINAAQNHPVIGAGVGAVGVAAAMASPKSVLERFGKEGSLFDVPGLFGKFKDGVGGLAGGIDDDSAGSPFHP